MGDLLGQGYTIILYSATINTIEFTDKLFINVNINVANKIYFKFMS